MRGPLFQNRVAAIAIVVLTLAGVASLVGTEDNEGALASATQALAEKAAASAGPSDRYTAAPAAESPQPAAASPPPLSSYPTEFADDESLIDDAQGFDPSPFVDDPAAGEVVAFVEGSDASPPASGQVPPSQPVDGLEP